MFSVGISCNRLFMCKMLFVLCVSFAAQLGISALPRLHSKFEGYHPFGGQHLGFDIRCAQEHSKMCISTHILKVPTFWDMFTHEVETKKSWKCRFPPDIMTRNITEDAARYRDASVFQKRRKGVTELASDDNLWSTAVLGACREIAEERDEEFVKKFRNLHILEALKDFVDHLNFFSKVAAIMATRRQEVTVLGPHSSCVHDIDKLDPVMLVGYSERFEDSQTTSLWQTCVDHHTVTNPHHQAHCMWRDCCRCGTPATNNTEVCVTCDGQRGVALKEMVCDKVSRRLQKDLNGEVSDSMWDAKISFFEGLPAPWIDKAVEMMKGLKDFNGTLNTGCISIPTPGEGDSARD